MRRKGSGDGGPPSAHRVARDALLAEIKATPLDDDAALDHLIRSRADTVYHPTCTCRMGPDSREAVVDARLRAYGLDNLRIIDASVFPTVTSGNTNAPTVMVAEKGVAMMLEDLGA